MRYDERPTDHTPVHTDQLPDTPVRDRNIPASAWLEAPAELRSLGSDLQDAPVADYKRRIGPWLLWRAGPATGGDARYWACDESRPQPPVRVPAQPRRHGRRRRSERCPARAVPRLEGRSARRRGSVR